MANDVSAMLRKTLASLRSERGRIDRQISALEMALGTMSKRGPRSRTATSDRPRRRRRMSAAARKAVSERMKAAWARRKAGRVKKVASKK
jgi:hypothetical protein